MKLYILVIHHFFTNFPESINHPDHWVYNDLELAKQAAGRLQNTYGLRPMRIEEGKFNDKGKLICKRVICRFDADTDEDE